MEFWVGYKGEAYLHHIYCKVTNQIQGENQVIQSEHDVHIYIYICVCVCVCVCVCLYIFSHSKNHFAYVYKPIYQLKYINIPKIIFIKVITMKKFEWNS
jgi:hypothetical protein